VGSVVAMKRRLLVEVLVEVPEDDKRDAVEIARVIEGAIEVGADSEHVGNLSIGVFSVTEEST
jgi:diphthamide synthase subunit DPH2